MHAISILKDAEFDLSIVDMGNWKNNSLDRTIELMEKWNPNRIAITFRQENLFQTLGSICPNADIITSFYVLNELFLQDEEKSKVVEQIHP